MRTGFLQKNEEGAKAALQHVIGPKGTADLTHSVGSDKFGSHARPWASEPSADQRHHRARQPTCSGGARRRC